MFQKKVNTFQAPGMAGEFYDDSPRRVAPYIIQGLGNVLPTVGRAFTVTTAATAPNIAGIGGTGVFAGVLVNPKELVRSNGLTAGLTVSSGSIGSLCTMGRIWVEVSATVTVGAKAQFSNTTGEIKPVGSSGNADSGFTLIPGAQFVLVNAAAGEMAVLELN